MAEETKGAQTDNTMINNTDNTMISNDIVVNKQEEAPAVQQAMPE